MNAWECPSSLVRRQAPPTFTDSTVTLQRVRGMEHAACHPGAGGAFARLPGKRMVGQQSSGRGFELDVPVVWGSLLKSLKPTLFFDPQERSQQCYSQQRGKITTYSKILVHRFLIPTAVGPPVH